MERGANIFVHASDGSTPLDCAVVMNHTAVVDRLLQRYRAVVIEQQADLCLHAVLRVADYRLGNNSNNTGKVMLPIGTLTMEQMLALLTQFVSQNPECILAQDEEGELPLHIACLTASPVEVVRFFVEKDPDTIRAQDNNRAMPLHVACRGSAPIEVLRFLVEQDSAALFSIDSGGSVPLHVACRAGIPLENIKFLVEKGGVGTLTARDSRCALPLHSLCESMPSVLAVQYLLKLHPVAVTEKTSDGDLPIMVACQSSASEEVIYVLMRAYPNALSYMESHFSME